MILPDGTTFQGRAAAHWHHVALLIAKRTGKAIGLDAPEGVEIIRDEPVELRCPSRMIVPKKFATGRA